MRLRFRTVLVSVTLALLLATVAVIGIVALVFARQSAEDLSTQVMAQQSQRIAELVRAQLAVAVEQANLDRAMFASGRVDSHDKPKITDYFLDAIRAHPQLSYLSWSLEENGDHVTVEQDRDGTLQVIQLHRQPDNRLELHHAHVVNGKIEWIEVIPDKPMNDPRPRPYYVAAKSAGVSTWTETYMFLGDGGKETVPGLTRATPVSKPDGSFMGVLSADFDLYSLVEFLSHLELGAHGTAFLVELRESGEHRLLASSNPRAKDFVAQVDGEHASFEVGGEQYLAAYRRIDGDRGLHWIVALVQPEDDILGTVAKTRRTTIIVTVIATVVAILLAVLLAMQIGRALRRIAKETEAIGKFVLETKPVVSSSIVEVSQLAVAIEDMKRGLRSFQKFVPADLVRRIVESGSDAGLGGTRTNITMHFSDIADFTTISEKLPPEELVELLSEYLSLMSEEILATGGTIDKYIGDAVMAFWNAPVTVEDHAWIACKTVLANQAKLADRRKVWTAAGKPALHARVGLHTGDAVVGNIGSDARLDFTAIGDTVNLASRLEGLNKSYGTSVLISETTYKLVADRVVVRLLDRVAVKGKTAPISIYELIALREGCDAAVIERADRHTAAMTAYFAQRWDEAEKLLGDDKASRAIKDRIRMLREEPPADWDGVTRMTEK